MKLLILTDAGDVVSIVTRLEEYDFTNGLARAQLINTVVLAVANGLKHENWEEPEEVKND